MNSEDRYPPAKWQIMKKERVEKREGERGTRHETKTKESNRPDAPPLRKLSLFARNEIPKRTNSIARPVLIRLSRSNRDHLNDLPVQAKSWFPLVQRRDLCKVSRRSKSTMNVSPFFFFVVSVSTQSSTVCIACTQLCKTRCKNVRSFFLLSLSFCFVSSLHAKTHPPN